VESPEEVQGSGIGGLNTPTKLPRQGCCYLVYAGAYALVEQFAEPGVIVDATNDAANLSLLL
jgi:hypothetical protein